MKHVMTYWEAEVAPRILDPGNTRGRVLSSRSDLFTVSNKKYRCVFIRPKHRPLEISGSHSGEHEDDSLLGY
jgi:hypothetical protein